LGQGRTRQSDNRRRDKKFFHVVLSSPNSLKPIFPF
jgi:hypothetical protein